MKKAYVCNDCGYVYSENDVQQKINPGTKLKENCCVDGCGGFNLIETKVKEKYKLNPDSNVVERVRKGLKLKNGHCPCVLEESEDTICPCKQMRENNHCCCGLYVTD